MSRTAAIFSFVLLSWAARGDCATDLGPPWLHLGAGGGLGGGGIVAGETVRAISFSLGMSRPLRPALRLTFDAGYDRVGRSGPGVSIPELEITRDESNLVTGLAGLETFGPARSHSSPFLHAAVGLGYVAQGDAHIRDMLYTGEWTERLARGAREVRPAIDLEAGFRRLPRQGGTAPRASVRYLLLANRSESIGVVSVLLGLGF